MIKHRVRSNNRSLPKRREIENTVVIQIRGACAYEQEQGSMHLFSRCACW